ncbi:MAG: CHASE2 domain-containing protein, partial [Endomicrobiia bacterium]
MKKSNLAGFIISIISIVLIFILWITHATETWEKKFYDYKFLIRGVKKTSSDIVIVEIDENSLKRFGRWPWPRSILAKAIINLKNAGAKVIGTDIIFPEPSQDKSKDITLAKAIKYANCVVGAIYFEYIPQKVVETVNGQVTFKEVIEKNLIFPTKVLNIFKRLGFTNAEPDTDGALRYAKTYEIYQNEKYFSFNSQVASLFLNKKPEELNLPKIIYANFRGGAKT